VTVVECIISKFIAAWMVIGIALLLTFPMVITVFYLGSPDPWAIVCGYIGSFLLAGAYLAVASFTSSLTKSQVVSFILSVVFCFFLILAGWPQVTNMLVEWSSRELIDFVAAFSVWPYFHNIQRGVIDSRDLIYFFSLIGFGLFLTMITLRQHKGTRFSSIVGAVVVGLIIVLVNALSGRANYRLDLTENHIYTLSEASKQILKKIDKPVTIKFYCSRSSTRMPVKLKNFADRVEDLLSEYKDAGNANIIIEKYDPKPFSDAEDSAILDGAVGQLVAGGEKIYLGIAVTCGKKTSTLRFLSPLKENLLEYEITNAVTEVFRTKKPVVGVMSVLPVLGGPPSQAMMRKGIFTIRKPWIFIRQLKKDYVVKKVRMDAQDIDRDIDLLLILHPARITKDTQFAIDQFLLRGGKIIACVDPCSLITKNLSKNDSSLKGLGFSDMPQLFKAWGVTYDPHMAVLDAIQ
jgi:TRAP-type C4-dicarboxylate transport system permease small subunit